MGIMRKLKITCSECGNSDHVAITEHNQIIWGKSTFIISGRHRLDGNWGWQCLCGNNSLLTVQERTTIKNLQFPDPLDIEAVVTNLIPEPNTRFAMEAA